MHAFLYQADGLKDLGKLGGTNIYALSINDAGQVAGVAETGTGLEAFLYQNGSATNLGTLGGLNSYAYGINSRGQIVGYIDTPAGARAFVYQDGSKTEIGTLGGTNSFAFAVNTSLEVAGSSLMTDNRSTHAFLWQTNSIIDLNQLVRAANGWELHEARGINDRGEIVGSGIVNERERAFLYHGGAVTDLGTLPGGTNSYALAVNNNADVVGASSIRGGVHSFLWRQGLMIDLNALVDASAGWELREATGINDLGQIVGWGIINSQEHAFLLTPLGPTSGTVETTAARKFRRPLVDGNFTVSITNPVTSAVFSIPTNITLCADASDSFGSVTQVQFFVGATLLGSAATSPYSVTWTSAPVGNYSLTAVASDDGGLNATSAVVSLTVTMPAASSLKLWLKPDVGVSLSSNNTLSTWQDQSGNGNNATQTAANNQPSLLTNALNGFPVAHFDGNSRYLNLPNLMNRATQGEAFVVLRAAQDMPSVGRSLWRFGTSYYPEFYTWTDGNIYEDFGNTVRPSIGDPTQPLDHFQLFVLATIS
jgi:probable HAF family extracellular repeat protein